MISVCLATYNGEKFIKEQLDSILIQLNQEDELIISDDKSTDNTIQLIKEYNDNRIKLITNNGLKGHTYNFENALKQASGDYIFFSDQDDVWLPNKVKTLSELLLKHSAVFSDAFVVDANLNILYESFFKQRNAGRGILKNFFKNTYFGFGMAFRRDLLKYALPFPRQGEMGHDMILGFIADMKNSVYFLHTPLTLYRRHEGTVTRMGTAQKRRSLCLIVKGRIIEAICILKLYLRILKTDLSA